MKKKRKEEKQRAIPVRKMPPFSAAFLVMAFCSLVFSIAQMSQ